MHLAIPLNRPEPDQKDLMFATADTAPIRISLALGPVLLSADASTTTKRDRDATIVDVHRSPDHVDANTNRWAEKGQHTGFESDPPGQ